MANVKKSLAFLCVVLCGISLLNCMPREPSQTQAEKGSIARAEQREKEFMERRELYIKENGHAPNMNQQLKPSSMLIQKNEMHEDF